MGQVGLEYLQRFIGAAIQSSYRKLRIPNAGPSTAQTAKNAVCSAQDENMIFLMRTLEAGR
jgi:hypothetical protein